MSIAISNTLHCYVKSYSKQLFQKAFILSCLLLLFLPNGSAQHTNLDSLWNIWNDENQVTIKRIEALNQLAIYYSTVNQDSALLLFNQNLEFIDREGNIESKPKILYNLAEYHYFLENFEKAIDLYEEAKVLYNDLGDDENVLDVELNLANCYFHTENTIELQKRYERVLELAIQSNNETAILDAKYYIARNHIDNGSIQVAMDYLKQVISLAEKLNNKDTQTSAYISMGIIEEEAKSYEAATDYFNKALTISKTDNNLYNTIYGYSNLARIQYLSEDSLSAINYYKKSLFLADSLNHTITKMVILREVIKFYLAENDTAAIQPYVTEVLEKSEQSNSLWDSAEALMYAGILEQFQGNHKKALEYCKESKKILEQADINASFREVCQCIYKSEKQLGNNATALVALEEYLMIRDTLFNEDRKLATAKLTTEYQYEKEKEVTDAIYQANLERQSLIQKGMGIGLGLLGLLAFFIFRNNRNKAKANALLSEKNQEISQQKEALEKSNYTKDHLFAIIGHDLRKPAVVFQGIARKVNYLLKKGDHDRIQELGESIENNALGLTKLTDNLLNWALTQKDALTIKPEELNLNAIVKETKLVLGRLAEAKNIEIISEIPQGSTIMADKNSMLTIIRNLVDNAIKYTPENGQVIITSQEGKEGLELTIKDTGVGIPKDRLNQIFLLQDGKSTQGTQGEKGTGLGLHLVKELVDLNQGNISVSSEPNEGTAFVIQLPKAA